MYTHLCFPKGTWTVGKWDGQRRKGKEEKEKERGGETAGEAQLESTAQKVNSRERIMVAIIN